MSALHWKPPISTFTRSGGTKIPSVSTSKHQALAFCDYRTCHRVFARRLATTPPYWLPAAHRYNWDRYAVATVPRLPGSTKEDPEQVLIPWPKTQARRDPERRYSSRPLRSSATLTLYLVHTSAVGDVIE